MIHPLHCQMKNICFCLFPFPAVKDKLRYWINSSGYHWGVKITSKKLPNQNSHAQFPMWQWRKHPGKFLRENRRNKACRRMKSEAHWQVYHQPVQNHSLRYFMMSAENWAANRPKTLVSLELIDLDVLIIITIPI